MFILGHIQIKKVASDKQITDCMTKGMVKTMFEQAH